MTKGQIWAIIILGFILVVIIVLSSLVYSTAKLVSTPSTTEFEINGKFIIQDENGTSLEIDRIYGKFDSRILDYLDLLLSPKVESDFSY